MSIITIATTKGGAGKTMLARLILARLSAAGLKVAALDADATHTLTDWVNTSAKSPITAVHTIDETQVVPTVAELHENHDVVVIDTAGAANQATVFAIGCADLILTPVMFSSADIVEAIKTANLVKSASAMLKCELTARIVLTAYQPGTNVAEYVEQKVIENGLTPIDTRLHRLVAFQEMTFTGIPPITGPAGAQTTAFLEEVADLAGFKLPIKLTS